MSWNRWTTRVLGGLVALAAVGGCKQQLFIEPSDYAHAVTTSLPPHLETNPHAAIIPPSVDRQGAPPATVMDPTRPPRYVTLKECIALSLEQGNTGLQQISAFGTKNEVSLPTFSGGATGQTTNTTDAIRALALDTGSAAANIERALSIFDTRWITSMQWQKNDNPVAAQFVSFQQQNDSATFSSALVKPLPTGGIAGITFSTSYTKYANIPAADVNSFISPNYQPQLQFVFEQPLLQLFGVEINQIANSPPTSLLISGLTPSGQATSSLGIGNGIVITRVRLDQQKAEFERNVNWMLVNVETAYWNLYAAYYNLYAQEEGLRQSYEGYRFTEARVRNGADQPQQLDQARAQLELFRGQIYAARQQVLESERQLRGLIGLRSDDGKRLVPLDEPNLAPYRPDFYEAANDAIARRPELMIVRQDVKIQQLNVILQKNLRRPDLRFYSSYNIAGLGTRLDGSESLPNPSAGTTTPGNALTNFADNKFNSWTLGLRLNMPLGFRDGNSLVKQADLTLTRSYLQLRDTELKVLETLVLQYRQVFATWAQIPPARARREALQLYVDKFRARVEIGAYQSTEYFNYLQVQRDLATAISTEFQNIANYNAALSQLEFAKGTIMQYNNISLTEGALPKWIQKRAVDHEQERTKAALAVRERPAGDPAPTSPEHIVGPAGSPPSLPPVTKFPPAPDLPQEPGSLPAVPNIDPKMPQPNPLPAPNTLPKMMNPDALMSPLPGQYGAAQMQPLPAPTPVPGSSAAPQDPGAIFVPTGERVSVPRIAPFIPPTGNLDGPVGPPTRIPSSYDNAQPTVPQSPTDSGTIPAIVPPPRGIGTIPATLPPAGGVGLPTTPMSITSSPY